MKEIIIGDTPAQLGQIEAAHAMMIDGKVVTKADYLALAAELEILAAFRDEVVDVMNNSHGVVGWHHNHTIATWDELFPIVPDTESPAACLADVRAEAGRAGFWAGVNWVFDSPLVEITSENTTDAANQYAESIRQGGAE
jgi:hypothetical protein